MTLELSHQQKCPVTIAASLPSLRAKRSNPESHGGGGLDRFVASLVAMTEDKFALRLAVQQPQYLPRL
jgi:hypothetical protein